MKFRKQCKVKLNKDEVVVMNGGCEIQDPNHGEPETLWDKIWDIIRR